jgi:hypothetical protein
VTPATTLGIRRCALVVVTIVTTIVRTAMIFCFFDLIYFWDLVPFVSATMGLLPLFPSTAWKCVEHRKH